MRLIFKITIGLLALALSACEMKLPRAKTTPPPQPASAKEEPPQEPAPAGPLSSPQTQVRLPSPQPIDPEAVVTPPVNVPAEPSQSHQAHRGNKRQGPQPATAPSPGKPETLETAEAPPPTETQRPPIGPVLSDEERRRWTEEIYARLKDVDQMLSRIAALRLSDAEKSSQERIRSWQKLSRELAEHGEIQQASNLVDRAVLLAQEVLRGHQ